MSERVEDAFAHILRSAYAIKELCLEETRDAESR